MRSDMSNDSDKPDQVTSLTLLIRALRADLARIFHTRIILRVAWCRNLLKTSWIPLATREDNEKHSVSRGLLSQAGVLTTVNHRVDLSAEGRATIL